MDECALCLRVGESVVTGKLFNDGNLAVHQNCMLFSSNLVNQNSQDIDDFGGFCLTDIKKEIRRGSKLRCSLCRKKGATVGCEVEICQKSFHYPCAREDEARIVENEAMGIYRIYCRIHKNCEDLESSGTSSSKNASSRTNNGNTKTIGDNYHHGVTQLKTFKPMTSEYSPKKRIAIRRISSSDSDESDNLPMFTGIGIQPRVKSKHGSKQKRLQNDAKQNEIFCNSNSTHEEKMGMSSHGRPGTRQEAQSNEARQRIAKEAVVFLHHLSEESVSDGGNCSDTSANIDQEELHQEIDISQQGVPKTKEGMSIPNKNTSPGQAEKFWKICKRAQCLEKIFLTIQKDLNSLQQNIANGNATSKDYEIAMAILLIMNSCQEIMSEFQSEMQQNLQQLEEEKLCLQRRANLVEKLAMFAHSLNRKAER